MLTNNDIKTLEKLLSLSQEGTFKVMNQYLSQRYEKVTSASKYIYAIGDIPVALVAHLDTVFPNGHKDLYYDHEKGVMFSPQGAGFDDRAGIFGIIKILSIGLRPHIILLTDEETGAHGALELIKDCPKPFAPIKYLIELDRHGTNDCVFYECDNKDFEKYIQSFGYTTAEGIFSDIYLICPEWEIAGVNLSIGYQNEHTYSEILFVEDFLNSIGNIALMLKDISNIETFKYIQKPINNHKLICTKCNKKVHAFEALPVLLKDDIGHKIVCSDCLDHTVSWCELCGRLFEKSKQDDAICFSCKKEV